MPLFQLEQGFIVWNLHTKAAINKINCEILEQKLFRLSWLLPAMTESGTMIECHYERQRSNPEKKRLDCRENQRFSRKDV